MKLSNLMVIWSHNDGPTGGRDSIQYCIDSRQSWRGRLVAVEESWGNRVLADGTVIEELLEPGGEQFISEPLVLEVDNNNASTKLNWNQNYSNLQGKSKLTLFGHGTVHEGKGAMFVGTVGGPNGGRRLMYADELAQLLKVSGFQGKSIDIIACVSYQLAQELSSRLPGVMVKGYSDPIRIDPPADIMLADEWDEFHNHRGKATMSGSEALRQHLVAQGIGLGAQDDETLKHRYFGGNEVTRAQWQTIKASLQD